MPHTFLQRLQRFISPDRAALASLPTAGLLADARGAAHLTAPAATASSIPDAAQPDALAAPAQNLLYFKIGGTPDAPLLAWATSDESASACFNVECSTDGRTWTSFHLTAAVGAGGKGAAYAVPQKPAGSSSVFYRLRQMMLDGTTNVSEVIVHEGEAAAPRVAITPNPVGDVLQLRLPDAQPAALSLRSPQGTTILQTAAHGASAMLDLKAVPRGVYFLTVMQAGMEEILRVVKE